MYVIVESKNMKRKKKKNNGEVTYAYIVCLIV